MGAQWKHAGRMAAGAAKGALFTRLSKEITVAARAGDPSPDNNPRLRAALEAARKQSMTRDTIDRAIKRGSGLLDGNVQYETLFFEGFTPHQVPIIVECLTDNRNRAAADVRVLFRKGQLGSVQWMFDRVGVIEASHPSRADAEEAAIEAGAQDLEPGDDGVTHFYTAPHDLDTVRKALEAAGWKLESAALVWRAKNPVTVAPEHRHSVDEFLAEMDEDDDVQTLFVGIK